MGKKPVANWAESPAGRAVRPGFEGHDTRIFSNDAAPSPIGKPLKGISLTGGDGGKR